jgi:hypothetical protein
MRTFALEVADAFFFSPGISAFNPDKPLHKQSFSPTSTPLSYVRVDIQVDMSHRFIHQGALVVEHLRDMDQQTQKSIRASLIDSLRIRP